MVATGDDGPPAWELFADVVLRMGVMSFRSTHDISSHDFAGLYIDEDDVNRSLEGIAGNEKTPGSEETRELVLAELEEARSALQRDLHEPATPFSAIAWNAGVSTEAAEVFAVLCAAELSRDRARLVAYIQDNVTLPRLTLSGIGSLFPRPHLGPNAVAPDSRLTRAGLVAVSDDSPWATAMVSVFRTVLWTLTGDRSVDPDLPHDATVVSHPGVHGSHRLVAVSGADRQSRRIAAFATLPGELTLTTPLPASEEEWFAVVREATLSGLSVVLELDATTNELTAQTRSWIERADHVTWAVSSRRELAVSDLPDRQWRDVRVTDDEATPEEWEAALGTPPMGGHHMNREQLRLTARALAANGGSIEGAVRRVASGQLDRHALRISPSRDWNDLVLPPDQFAQLRELAARYRRRDLVYETWGFRAAPSAGVVALFAGPSGTGKTLTAEIIAGDLGLDVYKVDLSAVVSKYIGETEKNLESIFSAASAGNVVLFFDEADSLFGKRSEVSDAHDRYANIEVSYLLQRLERYDGLVVLATNLQKNIDQAFLRRIHVSVEFPMPEQDERRAIWQLSFPSEAPTADLDFDFLAAQFKLSGGSIRNASLNAAFLAAEAGKDITMDIVMFGLKREFQKLGRLLTESEFDRYHELVKGGIHAPAAR